MKIKIKGQEYPFASTMGAMRRFKRETGKDVSKMDRDEVDDLLVYFWCCVASACHAEGVKFAMSVDDFADNIDSDTFADFINEFVKEQGQQQKKTSGKK